MRYILFFILIITGISFTSCHNSKLFSEKSKRQLKLVPVNTNSKTFENESITFNDIQNTSILELTNTESLTPVSPDTTEITKDNDSISFSQIIPQLKEEIASIKSRKLDPELLKSNLMSVRRGKNTKDWIEIVLLCVIVVGIALLATAATSPTANIIKIILSVALEIIVILLFCLFIYFLYMLLVGWTDFF